jgi:glyoxylase-like metal-dependent hydrolase (beta-lactamase superfamily II)
MSPEQDRPASMAAEVHILFNGYLGDHTASTVGFVRDGAARVVIDPGMVPDRRAILSPLAALNESGGSITDVVFSHHHPDHTLNAALFPNARFHDHWAIYEGDLWKWRRAEGFLVSPAIRLIETPGHTPQDITTLVGTSAGVVAFTHLWWSADAPAEDPYATDAAALHAGRARVLRIAGLAQIVPGHGAPFIPSGTTPR